MDYRRKGVQEGEGASWLEEEKVQEEGGPRYCLKDVVLCIELYKVGIYVIYDQQYCEQFNYPGFTW